MSSAIEAFDIENDSAHVLKSSRETLATCVRNYQSIFDELLEHTEADADEIVEHSENFRAAHTGVSAQIESKMEEVRQENVVDNIPSLKCDFMAINLSFREFKVFADETSPDCVSPSEARVRLKDLELVNQQYLEIWKQIYEKETTVKRKDMEEERKQFSIEFYKPLAWFHAQILSRSSSQPPPNHSTSQPIVKLPKIELPTYNGDPEL